jgi:acid phosphatase family membrane protein YuiD
VVVALTTTIGIAAGARSSLFSICLMFSLYFIAEAGGLRRDVGRQARALNALLDHLRESGAIDQQRLKELVGHTWTEVGGGLLLGLAVGAAFAYAARP